MIFCFPGEWHWESIDGSVRVPLPPPSVSSFVHQYDLCVTGEGLARLTCETQLLHNLLPYIQVFARVSPKQKVGHRKPHAYKVYKSRLQCRWMAKNV